MGNAAEHFSAITSATRNHMEISLTRRSRSPYLPRLFWYSRVLSSAGVPLDLNFSLLEVAMFGLVTGLYALINLDGESTWLEGLLLCAFYLIQAVGTLFPLV